MEIPSLYIIGNQVQGGTYLLRIRLKRDATLRFGRFKKGKLITLPAGEYVYIGSALSEKGSTSLTRRLARHATRSADKPPHAIRAEIVNRFVECGLGTGDLVPKRGKTLHWNIDFLLDLHTAEIVNILVIRSSRRLENRMAQRLEHDPHTEIIERGLGANDAPGNTHLLRVRSDKAWWASVIDNASTALETARKSEGPY